MTMQRVSGARPYLQHLALPLAVRRHIAVGADLILIPVAYAAAFLLRFDLQMPQEYHPVYLLTLPGLLAIRLLTFEMVGVYRCYWRHFGLRDLGRLAFAVSIGTCVLTGVLLVVGGLGTLPRSIVVLEWGGTIFIAGGARGAARWLAELWRPIRQPSGERTLIIGAGGAAERFLRQVQHDGRSGTEVVGLIDDDPATHGRALHGVTVLGGTDELAPLAARTRASRLVVAISSLSGTRMREIVDLGRATGLELKVLPSLQEMLYRRVPSGQVRDVQIEDLLGREVVHLDLDAVESDLTGRTILVTGAAGSIGSGLVHHVARYKPARLILLERAESPLYFVHLELCRAHPDIEVVPVMADICDLAGLQQIFAVHRPDYVFHAAAYKHVPLLEANAAQAIQNNVLGTYYVAACAAEHGTSKFVFISTDKAVSPRSVLGLSKRIAERLILELPSLRDSQTDFRAVRFGNVLGSDGSVIPLFQRQLRAGGPLTVTHPAVTRYFMTIPEAVQLVLAAAALPEARGRICMLEMGRAVRILDLAEQLIRLSGLEPYRDVEIRFSGLRPGEKLHEVLVASSEATIPTSHAKIRIVQCSSQSSELVEQNFHRLLAVLPAGNRIVLLREAQRLVPEYVPWTATDVAARGATPDERTTRPPAVRPVLAGAGSPPAAGRQS